MTSDALACHADLVFHLSRFLFSWRVSASRAVKVPKWLERRSCNLEFPSLNLPGTRALFLFFDKRQSVLNQSPPERCIFAVFPAFLFPIIISSELAGTKKHLPGKSILFTLTFLSNKVR